MPFVRLLARSVVVIGLTAASSAFPVPSQAVPIPTFVVNSTGNASDAKVGNGICATSTNKCTLRAAIEESNSNSNPNGINFNIPCSFPCLFVNINDGNFAINNPVIINGTTQAAGIGKPLLDGNGGGVGFDVNSGNTSIQGLALIEFGKAFSLSNAGTGNVIENNCIGLGHLCTGAGGGNAYGVFVEHSADQTIRNNVISNNTQAGVFVVGLSGIIDCNAGGTPLSTNVVIEGNKIGTNAAGDTDLGNAKGIRLVNAPGVTVRNNLISGNDGTGVQACYFGIGSSPAASTVQGNSIGVSGSGAAAMGNTGMGVHLDNAGNYTISDNTISANSTGIALTDQGGSGGNAQNVSISANRIGTGADGTGDLGNSFNGIRFGGDADNNTISSNLISGNNANGILLESFGAFGPDNTTITGNQIGTTGAGAAALGNSLDGVAVASLARNTFIRSGNVISGNVKNGIHVLSTSAGGVVIQGNYIGTDAVGSGDVGNGEAGVLIEEPATLVGGSNDFEGNVISGNTAQGVQLLSGGNRVLNNRIGTDAGGSASLSNLYGVVVSGDSNQIGDAFGGGNLISGDAQSIGVSIAKGTGNFVQGNFIGTDAAGTAVLGNNGPGVHVLGANTTVGGTTAGARNVISGNHTSGVWISGIDPAAGAGAGNLVQGNYIGTNVTGAVDLGNNNDGVLVSDGATNNTIGGTPAGARNVISGNFTGVELDGPTTTNNSILGNRIGTKAGGGATLGNTQNGVLIDGAPKNFVGGSSAGAGNLISGNLIGLRMTNDTAEGNLVRGNFIGTDRTGTVDLGNSAEGVFLDNAPRNQIGGRAAVGAGNVISGNDGTGVRLLDVKATGNLVQGNLVGTKAGGGGNLGNGSHGVWIKAASANRIGGTLAGTGNTIAFNAGDGVFVESGARNSMHQNVIQANVGLGIDLFPTGVTPNDPQDPDKGANALQNFPVLNSAVSGGGNVTIGGTLNSTPNTAFVVEFFSSNGCDPTGFGEGARYLGAKPVTTGAAGNVTFTATFSVALASGQRITATATNSNGNTSEFSKCRTLA